MMGCAWIQAISVQESCPSFVVGAKVRKTTTSVGPHLISVLSVLIKCYVALQSAYCYSCPAWHLETQVLLGLPCTEDASGHGEQRCLQKTERAGVKPFLVNVWVVLLSVLGRHLQLDDWTTSCQHTEVALVAMCWESGVDSPMSSMVLAVPEAAFPEDFVDGRLDAPVSWSICSQWRCDEGSLVQEGLLEVTEAEATVATFGEGATAAHAIYDVAVCGAPGWPRDNSSTILWYHLGGDLCASELPLGAAWSLVGGTTARGVPQVGLPPLLLRRSESAASIVSGAQGRTSEAVRPDPKEQAKEKAKAKAAVKKAAFAAPVVPTDLAGVADVLVKGMKDLSERLGRLEQRSETGANAVPPTTESSTLASGGIVNRLWMMGLSTQSGPPPHSSMMPSSMSSAAAALPHARSCLCTWPRSTRCRFDKLCTVAGPGPGAHWRCTAPIEPDHARSRSGCAVGYFWRPWRNCMAAKEHKWPLLRLAAKCEDVSIPKGDRAERPDGWLVAGSLASYWSSGTSTGQGFGRGLVHAAELAAASAYVREMKKLEEFMARENVLESELGPALKRDLTGGCGSPPAV
eukprot:2932957-Amphidinium_carterae.1